MAFNDSKEFWNYLKLKFSKKKVQEYQIRESVMCDQKSNSPNNVVSLSLSEWSGIVKEREIESSSKIGAVNFWKRSQLVEREQNTAKRRSQNGEWSMKVRESHRTRGTNPTFTCCKIDSIEWIQILRCDAGFRQTLENVGFRRNFRETQGILFFRFLIPGDVNRTLSNRFS